jgi:hypothetical protein
VLSISRYVITANVYLNDIVDERRDARYQI